MGNYKFRLSDMIPNAWFHKLKDMSHKGTSKKQSMPQAKRKSHSPRTSSSSFSSSRTVPKPFSPPPAKILPNRASYYITSRVSMENPKASYTHLPVEPPRKSKKRSRRQPIKGSVPTTTTTTTKLATSSVFAGCGCRDWKAESIPDSTSPPVSPPESSSSPGQRDYYIDGDAASTWSHSCRCIVTASATDIIIDMANKTSLAKKLEKIGDLDALQELELPPILTKPAKKEAELVSGFENKNVDEKVISSHCGAAAAASPVKPRRSPPRFHLRASSPRLANKKVQAVRGGRRSTSSAASTKQGKGRLSESLAVVKSSSDPRRDFRDSMMEMIVENDIRTSKDLEDLLACYLTLNANEYHDLIVKVFEQIWFDLY